MGCFSFICQGCKQPINSSSFRGERCVLFLLKNGIIIESMNGEYDSYGRVFDQEGNSILWSIPWSEVCALMFDKQKNNGVAAYHERCYEKIAPTLPMFRSNSDPNQGWGIFKEPPIPFKPGIPHEG